MSSLGHELLRWSHAHLPSPADPSRPLVLSDEQARFVIAFYELDAGGRYVYRRAALQAAKGWGKSPLGAIIALAEFAGPVAPATPWVQLAACSEEQATSNVYSLIWTLLSENDGRAARELGIDLGRGRLYLPSKPGAKLEAVSASWGSREGQRLTFGLLDESHQFLQRNGGHRLARTLRRNAAKTDGRTLELSNAPELGEESIAEETEAHYREGRPGILFEALRPSREPTADMSDAELAELLAEVYHGAPWVELGRLLREVRDPGAPWGEQVRFFFNLPAGGTLAAVEPILWEQRHAVRELVDKEPLALGFDGSHSRDGTALVACTIDGHLVPLVVLERPDGAGDDWRIDRSRVQAALEDAFGRYDVQHLYCDPWQWQDELDEWADRWPDKVTSWPTNSTRRMAPAVDRFRTALAEGRLTHPGHQALTRHVLAARLKPVGRDEDGRGRYLLEKAGPGRLIDACVAAILAYEASSQLTVPRVYRSRSFH